ncbi:YopX family protein [Lactiplantibacillus plantarum]|nr:YopX family protein [Lactiplantibacillus plantarum]MBS0944655.1 hypothetical protein [Lactiplantibacillus plantarum]
MIKFRGIPISGYKTDDADFDGTFVYGNYVSAFPACDYIIGDIIDDGEDFICPEWWVPVDPSTVEQFTGLKDGNGKEIYEGDVAHAIREDNYDRTGKILFDEGAYVLDNGMDRMLLNPMLGEFTVLKVLGNVHENPELLEEEK